MKRFDCYTMVYGRKTRENRKSIICMMLQNIEYAFFTNIFN